MIAFGRPEAWLLLIPMALALVWLARRGRSATSPGRRLASLVVRLLVCACVVGALADPVLPHRVGRARRLVLLLDVSDSAREDARTRGADLLRSVRAADPDAALETFAFAGRTAPLAWPLTAESVDRPEIAPGATDLAHALSVALAAARRDEALRIILVTDGHESSGDARPVARTLRNAGARLDVHPLAAPTPRPRAPRARVLALDAPDECDAGAPVRIRAVVETAGRDETTVVLRVDGEEVGEARAIGDEADRPAVAVFDIQGFAEGSHRIEAAVRGETEPDVLRALTARAGPRVLVLREEDAAPGAVEASIEASGIEVVPVLPGEWRPTLESARPPDVLVLEQPGMVRTALASFPELLGALRRGVSLVVTDGLPLSEVRETPLAAILPLIPDPPAPTPKPAPPPEDDTPPGPGVAVKEAEKEALRVALLLIVDTSGSMRGAKLAMARQAAVQAADALDGQDLLGVIGFADEPYWVIPFTPAGNRRRIENRLMRMLAQGGTNINLAVKDGIAALRRVPFGIRHAILLSDGHTPPALFKTLVEGAAAERITLSAIAIGDEADTRLLDKLATWGRGAFKWASRPEEIPRLVTDDAVRVLSEGRPDRPTPAAAADPAPGEKPPTPDDPPPATLPEEPLRRAAPHPALAGLPAQGVPPLGGIRASRARAAAWIALETERDGRPVLAEWRYGLGRVLTLAADLEGPGARTWREWPELPRVWAQAVRALAASAQPTSAPRLEAVLRPDAVHVRATREGGAPRLQALDGKVPRDLETQATPDGGVEAVFPRDSATGRHLIRATAPDGSSRTLVVDVPSRVKAEAAVSGTAEERLRALAAEAGGRYRPEAADVPRTPDREREEPLAWWLLVIGAGLLVVDVGVRRAG